MDVLILVEKNMKEDIISVFFEKLSLKKLKLKIFFKNFK